MVGESGESWCTPRKWAKRVARHWVSRSSCKKPSRAPAEPYKRPCFSKVRRQPEKKKAFVSGWETDEGEVLLSRNWQKGMLRYLEKSEKVKVGITELQERVEVPVQIGISIQQVAQQATSQNGQKIFEVFWQEEEEEALRCLQEMRSGKGSVDLERSCQDTSREIQMLSKRQEILKKCKALQLVRKDHDLPMYQNEKEEAKILQAPGKRGRLRKWLGRYQENIKMARLGIGEKNGRKRVEAGAWRRSGSAGNHFRVGCGGRHFRGLGGRKPPWAGRRKALLNSLNGEGWWDWKSEKDRVSGTQDFVREAKSTEHEAEEDRNFRTERSKRSAKAFVSRRPSAIGSWLRWWYKKEVNHIRPVCVRSLSTKTCRQKEKKRCQMCSGDRWWKRRRVAEGWRTWWGKKHICVGCGNIFSKKKQSEEVSIESWPTKKSEPRSLCTVSVNMENGTTINAVVDRFFK